MSDIHIIEENAPEIPPARAPRENSLAGVLRRLEPGQSLLTPCSQATVLKTAQRLGLKVTTRKADKGRTRVWRT